jgi:hypothetical protein
VACTQKYGRERGIKGILIWMHATRLRTSHVLTEVETDGFS